MPSTPPVDKREQARHIAPRAEHHHRDIHGGTARAAVFGVSDGLVSNISLSLGVASVVLGAIAAILVGAALARFTGRSVLFSASRQLLIAAVAASVTFGIGSAVGVSTG